MSLSEREPRTKQEILDEEYVVAGASGIIGAILGVCGAIADSKLLSDSNPDGDAIILATGIAIFGACLVVNGGVRYLDARSLAREINKGGE